jgi:hypothetical protein
MSESRIHILCSDTGTWAVHIDPGDDPVSEHSSETSAEIAALELARSLGGADVVVHDRYRRVHGAMLDGARST